MASAANDAAMLALISTANSNIASIVSAQPTLVAALNAAFDSIASSLSKEKNYQLAAGISYFDIQSGIQSSVLSFVQNLPQYGNQTQACGPAYFLNQVADTTKLAGQSIVGCMREGQNSARLTATQLGIDTTPATTAPVTPSPVVVPVY